MESLKTLGHDPYMLGASRVECVPGLCALVAQSFRAETIGQFVLNFQFSRVQTIQICGRPIKITCSTDTSDLLVEPQVWLREKKPELASCG